MDKATNPAKPESMLENTADTADDPIKTAKNWISRIDLTRQKNKETR